MKNRHRIFIAINLPLEIKRELYGYSKKWPEFPAKWTTEENLHITLVFLGDLTDIEMGEACIAVKEASERHNPFNISLEKIAYGPEKKLPPKMVWAMGKKSKELSLLKKDMEDSLLQRVNFLRDARSFSPHITLAKISAFGFRAIEPEERPEINEYIDLNFTVESIEVVESVLRRGGPQYSVIESFDLKDSLN